MGKSSFIVIEFFFIHEIFCKSKSKSKKKIGGAGLRARRTFMLRKALMVNFMGSLLYK
jgi:hypothetical protein